MKMDPGQTPFHNTFARTALISSTGIRKSRRAMYCVTRTLQTRPLNMDPDHPGSVGSEFGGFLPFTTYTVPS